MLLSESAPFSSDDYIFEMKIDGVRALAYIEPTVRLMSRNSRDMTFQYPELKEMHRAVSRPCVLDGEIAVIKDGRPDFKLIRHRFSVASERSANTAARQCPARFFAFDILRLDGEDITGLKLTERKRILSETAAPLFGLDIVPFIGGRGVELFAAARARNLEGIVAKRKEGKYHPGWRTHDWIKIRSQEYER